MLTFALKHSEAESKTGLLLMNPSHLLGLDMDQDIMLQADAVHTIDKVALRRETLRENLTL